ncbi:hypothetical protein [Schlesneria paludicola]|uniref:hypothetical protein n=1 Tax=Schlesneria paludicola TaxID=360056 RepID=UPI00029A52F6|nr:hypothetical protein [Schlesneria paludicola]
MKSATHLTLAIASCLVLSLRVHAQDEPPPNPLEEVTREMKTASDHLGKKATDKPTQKAQEDAVLKLDTLITELEKRKSGLGNGANPNPTRPAMDSTVRNGPGGMGDLHGARVEGDRWGELPAHERDRILQSLTEGFPPHYQAVLEAYYKRLAVEKKAEEPEMNLPAKPAAAMAVAPQAPSKKPATAMSSKPSTPAKKSDK